MDNGYFIPLETISVEKKTSNYRCFPYENGDFLWENGDFLWENGVPSYKLTFMDSNGRIMEASNGFFSFSSQFLYPGTNRGQSRDQRRHQILWAVGLGKISSNQRLNFEATKQSLVYQPKWRTSG